MAKLPAYVIQYFAVVGVEEQLTPIKQDLRSSFCFFNRPRLVKLELVQLPAESNNVMLVDTKYVRLYYWPLSVVLILLVPSLSTSSAYMRRRIIRLWCQ